MKVFIITGQTATGKTNYALELAKKYNGELVNFDSRQIYKHLDIITGKDFTEKNYKEVGKINDFSIGYYLFNSPFSILNSKIWLYDIVDPKTYFSSFDYVQCALSVIKDIVQRGKTPIIVGGTYFYLYHLLYNVETQNIPADWNLRNKLNAKSVNVLQNILKKINVQSFNQLNNSDVNNPQRLIRKIEILTYLKKHKIKILNATSFKLHRPISLLNKLHKKVDIEYHGFFIKNNSKLRTLIKQRVEKRIRDGAIKEVLSLLHEGYSESDPGLKTIGYTQLISYLKHKNSKEKSIEEWTNREFQYAKRQYTFMKRDENIKWHEV